MPTLPADMPQTIQRPTMPGWVSTSLDALRARQTPDGGWPYFARGDSAIEPTAIAVAALWALDALPDARSRALAFLESMQTPAGALRPQPTQTDPTTLSALAGLVMVRCGGDAARAARIADHLKSWQPRTTTQAVFGNDTSLKGFSWTPDTFSWVEPTAYGVLLFDALRRGDDPRIVESRRLLVDRASPNGGWNYGNPRVFNTVLESDPLPTALAMLALGDDPARPVVRDGAAFLRRCAADMPSPLTLAWMTIALRALGDDSIALDRFGPLLAGGLFSRESPWHHAAALLAAAPTARNAFVLPRGGLA